MAKKYYSTKIVGIGGEVSKFTSLVKMLVIFDDSMVLPELRDFSVLHSGNKITDVIKPGDVLKIADSEFKILSVGNEVNNNIKSLGHIVIKFNDDKDDLLEGSIHVEDKPIPKFRIGDEIAIFEGSSEALIGKTALVVGDDKTLCAAVALILNDNGARIVEDEDADILVKIK
ncbi:MAG: PTS glucitol/sorbitol transporter subunit IIA [Selenomonadaceae bacterium]|nr:PTS glucitol/sorbitol transporter subunit IIA [Selenomonadaceae bacterium]MBQ6759564.1 PTS glucitol/sorbitol transporter subunit IIA [Selenomonadaceae bacterium]MBR0102050.1 PTS glucitol/sorbitol transporter subunit IIA [Selenomonadaceae bacterium]